MKKINLNKNPCIFAGEGKINLINTFCVKRTYEGRL